MSCQKSIVKFWDRVNNTIKKGFDSEPVYNENYFETKIKYYKRKITKKTIFLKCFQKKLKMLSKTKKFKKILLQTKKGFPMILMKKIVVNKALIREIVMERIFVRKIKCKKKIIAASLNKIFVFEL